MYTMIDGFCNLQWENQNKPDTHKNDKQAKARKIENKILMEIKKLECFFILSDWNFFSIHKKSFKSSTNK